MLYSLKKIVIGHPYYSHLSKTAAFFCPQGGRCGDCWTVNNAIVFGPFFPLYLNQKEKKRNLTFFSSFENCSFDSHRSIQTFQSLNHANLECLKKYPKNLESGIATRRFRNYVSKPKRQIIFVLVFFTLLVVSVVLSCCSFGSNEKILCYSSIGRRLAK